jgi:hypothetical protein
VLRRVGDTLVWLGLILMVAGVVYFTPRFANYVESERSKHERESKTWRAMAYLEFVSHDATP